MKKVLIMSSLVFASALHTIAVEAGIGTTRMARTTTTVVAKPKATKSKRTTVEAGIGTIKKAETTTTAAAESKVTKKSLSATERANFLTDQMIRDLKLNNYQARTLRAINLEKVNRMMAIEANGGDPSKVDTDCKGVCKERDAELENLLSTDQYAKYFSNRPTYYKLDKDYAMGGYLSKPTAKVEKDNLDDNDDDASSSTGLEVASR
jgi:hypothetical protein